MEILIGVSAAIQAVASIVLAFFTLSLRKATENLAVESRKIREEGKKPQILAKLRPMPDHGDFIQLILSNVGRGAALNVEFSIEGDEEDFVKHEMVLRGTQKPINFMSTAEIEVYELGAARTLFFGPRMKPFEVVVKYTDVDGMAYDGRIKLDVRQFYDLAWGEASVPWRMMAALENIDKHLGRMKNEKEKFEKPPITSSD